MQVLIVWLQHVLSEAILSLPIYKMRICNASNKPQSFWHIVIITFHMTYPSLHSFGTALTCIFIYSPPMWTGVCRTGSIVHLTPHSTLSCCSMPRASARLPYSFTAQGIIIIRLLMHRPLMLFLLLLRFLVSPADFPFFLFYITGKHFIAKPNTIIL